MKCSGLRALGRGPVLAGEYVTRAFQISWISSRTSELMISNTVAVVNFNQAAPPISVHQSIIIEV